MASIHSKDTKPEVAVRKALHKMGYRFRLHDKKLPGSPDISLPKYKTAVFVHGCFWHHHKNCKDGRIPRSNRKYWKDKIYKNIARDKRKSCQLKRLGLKVITLWECQITNTGWLERKLGKIKDCTG